MALTTVDPNLVRSDAGKLGYRKNILHLDDRELSDLRLAFTKLYAISATTDDAGTVDPAGNADDERGYQWIAGVHGAPPPIYCQHGSPHFTTWHRAYLWWFEKLMQDQVPGVMLPWWDWSAEEAQTSGLPAAVTDAEWTNPETGQQEPNPLLAGFSQVSGEPTSRSPRPAAELAQLAAAVDFALSQLEFADFSTTLENPHGGLHVWVGGDMGSVPTAAYDPVFWLHHANVDRIWYFWQQQHPNAIVDDGVRSFVCAPFTLTGKDVLEVSALGYSYVDQESMVTSTSVQELAEAVSPAEPAADPAAETEPEAAAPTPAITLPLDVPTGPFRRATIEFVKVTPPVSSFIVHMYLDHPDATLETAKTIDEGYAGAVPLFGHGHCLGGPGHCDLPHRRPGDVRLPHHLEPFDTTVDVSFVLAAVLGRDTTPESIDVSLLAEQQSGETGDIHEFAFESISLVTRA